MDDSDNREAELPLLGIDFVFEMGMKKIEEQLKEIEALDVKLGILFGFLGTVLVALLAVVFTAEQSAVRTLVGWPVRISLLLGITLAGLALVNTFLAFRIRQYFESPRFEDILRWVHEDPKRTKFVFANTLLAAAEGNVQRLEDKQFYTSRALWCVFLGFFKFPVCYNYSQFDTPTREVSNGALKGRLQAKTTGATRTAGTQGTI